MVLFIRRESGKTNYIDSFRVEFLLLFLEEYVDPGPDERIEEYDQPYCGAY